MKILFITNLIPYPIDNGGKIKTYNTLKILSNNNDIDLMCFYEEDNELKGKEHLYKYCRNIDCIKKPITTSKNIKYMIFMAIKNIFSKMPLVVYKYMDKDFLKKLNENLDKNDYDVIYIDHLQLGGYIYKIDVKDKTLVLDEHNAECTIILRKAEQTKNLIKKSYLKYEYLRLKKFEAKIINEVDKVIVLSEEDKSTLNEISNVKEGKFTKIPIPIESNFIKKNGLKNENFYNILFLGTLSWFPNVQGIEWFVEKVVPLLDKEGFKYNLYIVGKDPSEKLKNISKTNDKIIVTGFVNDVNEYIEKCDFMVVPLFIGSGMRVKILESMSKNIPVISTSIGCEGIEVENEESILIANNEHEFIESINKLKNKDIYNKIRTNARNIFEEKYSVQALENMYLRVIEKKGDTNE